MKYACIRENRASFPVCLMCEVLGVSRTGFYAWCAREPSQRWCHDQRLLLEIRAWHGKTRQRYGSPRIYKALKKEGIRTSRKRVERLMREAELRAKRRRRFLVTTQSDHNEPMAPNLLDRRFGVEETEGLNQVWVADLTYLPTQAGWLFLAVVLDLASRRVVGWSTSSRPDSLLTLVALRRAIALRSPRPGLLHHSDRGVQ